MEHFLLKQYVSSSLIHQFQGMNSHIKTSPENSLLSEDFFQFSIKEFKNCNVFNLPHDYKSMKQEFHEGREKAVFTLIFQKQLI